MLRQVIEQSPTFSQLSVGRRRLQRDAILSLSSQWSKSWQELRGLRIGLICDNALDVAVALIALSDIEAEVVMLPVEEASRWKSLDCAACVHPRQSKPGHVMVTPHTDTPALPENITLLSSGTTGQPRPRVWRWDALQRQASLSSSASGGPWLTQYSMPTFAALQVLIHALYHATELIFVRDHSDWSGLVRRHSGLGIALATGTPTAWRCVVNRPPKHLPHISSISLGGEIADARLLSDLASMFPRTRLRHVYASSEYGSMFSVSDGRAGFPAAWLNTRRRSGALVLERDGQLHVSPSPGLPPVATGDLVVRIGDRVMFSGRSDDIINVGGFKVARVRVEEVLRTLVDIADVRVFGRRSPIAGNIVCAEIVPRSGRPENVVLQRARAHCRAELSLAEQPRSWKLVDRIATTPAGKARLR